MTRVGIVSLFGLYNFGNRLQGYAVNSILESLGVRPTTIVASRKLGLSVLKSRVLAVSERVKPGSVIAARHRRFQQFVSDQHVEYILLPSQISRLHRRFDWFVVGSDQVWHPRADLYPGTKLLEFSRPEQRIALAPSFGVTELPAVESEMYRLALGGFEHLSVREQEGADLVEGLTGARPQVLPDPTIGLPREEWERVAHSGSRPQDRYVLLYFLGGIRDQDREAVEAAATRLRARLINLTDQSSPFWASGPQDFLSLIRGAELVLTDSFHASIFSTVFEVPFYVFHRDERVSTYSRIATLLRTLGLERHEAGHLHEDTLLDQDFASARRALQVQRSELLQYMRTSLGDR
jgi:hypothetical protein